MQYIFYLALICLLCMAFASCSKDDKQQISEPPISNPGIWEVIFTSYTSSPELYQFDYVTARRTDNPEKDAKADSIVITVGTIPIPLSYVPKQNAYTAILPGELILTAWGETLPVSLASNEIQVFCTPLSFVHQSEHCNYSFINPGLEGQFDWMLDEDSDAQIFYLYSQGEQEGEYSEYAIDLQPSDRSLITPANAVEQYKYGNYATMLVQKNTLLFEEHRLITTHKQYHDLGTNPD